MKRWRSTWMPLGLWATTLPRNNTNSNDNEKQPLKRTGKPKGRRIKRRRRSRWWWWRRRRRWSKDVLCLRPPNDWLFDTIKTKKKWKNPKNSTETIPKQVKSQPNRPHPKPPQESDTEKAPPRSGDSKLAPRGRGLCSPPSWLAHALGCPSPINQRLPIDHKSIDRRCQCWNFLHFKHFSDLIWFQQFSFFLFYFPSSLSEKRRKREEKKKRK